MLDLGVLVYAIVQCYILFFFIFINTTYLLLFSQYCHDRNTETVCE